MAEAVGVVAASIELGKAIRKLQQKAREIRDAPEEVLRIINDVSKVNRLLAVILNQQDTLFADVAPIQEITDIQEYCAEAARDLLECAQTLNAQIEKNRWFGSLRTVVKSSVLRGYQLRLESAKSSLSLAQSTQSILIQHRQRLIEIDNQMLLQALSSRINDSHTSPLPQTQTPKSDTSMTTGNLQLADGATHLRAIQRPDTRYELLLPTRWLGWTLQLKAARYSNCWTWSIRPWNFVPGDSAIFEHSKRGDVDGLLKLLSMNEGSVTDVDSKGWSALHYAMANAKPDAVRCLIEHGADVNKRADRNMTPLRAITVAHWAAAYNPREIAADIKNMKFLIDLLHQAGCEDLIDNAELVHALGMYWSSCHLKLVGHILDTSLLSYVYPPYKELPMIKKLKLSVRYPSRHPDVFREQIGQCIDQKLLNSLQEVLESPREWLWLVATSGLAFSIRASPEHLSYHNQSRACNTFGIESSDITQRNQTTFIAGWRDILTEVIELCGPQLPNLNNIVEVFLENSTIYEEHIDAKVVTERLQRFTRELTRLGVVFSGLQKQLQEAFAQSISCLFCVSPWYDPQREKRIRLWIAWVDSSWQVKLEYCFFEHFKPDVSIGGLAGRVPGAWVLDEGSKIAESEALKEQGFDWDEESNLSLLSGRWFWMGDETSSGDDLKERRKHIESEGWKSTGRFFWM